MPPVISAIRAKWLALGGASSFLGQPLAEELSTPDGSGQYSVFQGGHIYWTATTGAHEVHGAIRDKWAAMGWELSPYGYPTSDEQDHPDGGRVSYFERGSIRWTNIKGIILSWDNATMLRYSQHAKAYVESYAEAIDCADLAILCLADFASQNGLPVKLRYYAGRAWNWYHYIPGESNAGVFMRKATGNLGALNVIDNTNVMQLANARAGDLIMTRWNASLGHTRIITEIGLVDGDYEVTWYQGNLPPAIPEKRNEKFSRISNVFGNLPRRWNFAQFG